jgi:hypothetical protein
LGIDLIYAVGGGISGDINSGTWIGDIYTTGDLTGDITTGDYLGSVTVEGSMAGSNITVTNSYLGSVAVSGDITDSHIRLADGPGDDDLSGHLESVYAGGSMDNSTIETGTLGSVYVGGGITEDGSDGDTDFIRALEGAFFVRDSGLAGWVYEGNALSFDGLDAFVSDPDD